MRRCAWRGSNEKRRDQRGRLTTLAENQGMAAIRRAAFTCGRCGLQFAAASLEVHHRHGRELGDGAANLQCLCVPCHAELEGRV